MDLAGFPRISVIVPPFFRDNTPPPRWYPSQMVPLRADPRAQMVPLKIFRLRRAGLGGSDLGERNFTSDLHLRIGTFRLPERLTSTSQLGYK